MVNCGAILKRARFLVSRRLKQKESSRSGESSSIRATISFPTELHHTLDEIARQKKVSLAWVVREAAEQYVADKWPLFNRKV